MLRLTPRDKSERESYLLTKIYQTITRNNQNQKQ